MYSPTRRDHGLVRIRSLRENFKLKYIIVAWENVTSSSASVHFCTLALSTGPSHHWHPEIFMPSTTKFFLAELPALLMEDTTGSETYNPSVSSTTSLYFLLYVVLRCARKNAAWRILLEVATSSHIHST